jgi:hypothetical protein
MQQCNEISLRIENAPSQNGACPAPLWLARQRQKPAKSCLENRITIKAELRR